MGRQAVDFDARTASDADVIRCTGEVVLIPKLLHPTVKRSDALAVVSCQGSCTRPHRDQIAGN